MAITYVINGKRVDPNGKPVEEVVSSSEATDTGEKKATSKSKPQTEKSE